MTIKSVRKQIKNVQVNDRISINRDGYAHTVSHVSNHGGFVTLTTTDGYMLRRAVSTFVYCESIA